MDSSVSGIPDMVSRTLAGSTADIKVFAEASPLGIVVARELTPVFANQAIADTFGYGAPIEIAALPSIAALVRQHEVRKLADIARSRLAGDELPKVFDLEGRRRDASVLWILATAQRLAWDGEELVAFTFIDVSEYRNLETELRRLATVDPLTEVPNRRAFLETASKEMRRAWRHDQALSFLILDIDRLKSINDRYGHALGDETVRAVSRACRETLRDTDSLGRLGGEEFAVVLPQTSRDSAVDVAERVRKTVAGAAIPIPNGQLHFTVSIGVTEATPDDMAIDAVLGRADRALFVAKGSGQNRVAWI